MAGEMALARVETSVKSWVLVCIGRRDAERTQWHVRRGVYS